MGLREGRADRADLMEDQASPWRLEDLAWRPFVDLEVPEVLVGHLEVAPVRAEERHRGRVRSDRVVRVEEAEIRVAVLR